MIQKHVLLGCAMVAMAAGTTEAKPSVRHPVISAGERAMDSIEIQNLMSRHEYMHAAGRNLEELDTMWVSRSGKYASTATFASPGWVMYGIETVRRAYGEKSHNDAAAARAKLAAIDPNVKDTDGFYGAGGEWVMHTSTTAIIEVAGDGKTAQGAWYSPGIGIMPDIKDGKVELHPTMFWEKYGGDFVKENGQWKIWHLQMAYDFTPGLPRGMVDRLYRQLGGLAASDAGADTGVEAGERQKDLPPGFRKPKYSYPSYSPERGSTIWPNLPKPYYTFGETYNNCNCDQEIPK